MSPVPSPQSPVPKWEGVRWLTFQSTSYSSYPLTTRLFLMCIRSRGGMRCPANCILHMGILKYK